MKKALDNSQEVTIYRQYVSAFGLDGRSTKKKNSISTRPTHCNSRCNTRRR
mgnify:FL=1